jgi:hypothetical protein
MRAAESRDVIDGGDERRRRHRPHAGHRAQPPDARVGGGDRLDALVGVRELLIHVPHDGQEGGEFREDAAGQRQLAEQGADDRDVARASPHEGLAHGEAGPNVTLLIGQAMRPPEGAQHARLGEGARSSSVRLDREPKTSANRLGSVRTRRSSNSPSSVRVQIWLSLLWTSMPT